MQVGVGRRDDPDVDPARPRRAEPLELAGLDDAQQLGLLAHRHVGDLVEEQRAPVGELEAADAIGLGVGERAAHVAEQLALEHAFRDAAGVDDHHRARRAARHRVQRPRDDALAGAVLAEDQDVGVRGTDARDHLQHALHRRRLGDQLGHALAAQQRVLGLEPLALAQRLAQLDLRADDRQQPRVVPRLLDEVARAAAHRFDRDLDAAPRRHDHDRQRRIDALDPRQQVQPFLAGGRVARVVEIDQGDVELARLERREHAGRRGRGLELEPFGLEQQPQRLEHVGLIVGDEHARLARAHRDDGRAPASRCADFRGGR